MVTVPPPPTTASWQKSIASGTGGCVEVARTHPYVWVRDSHNRLGPVLGFTSQGWATFLTAIQICEFGGPESSTGRMQRD